VQQLLSLLTSQLPLVWVSESSPGSWYSSLLLESRTWITVTSAQSCRFPCKWPQKEFRENTQTQQFDRAYPAIDTELCADLTENIQSYYEPSCPFPAPMCLGWYSEEVVGWPTEDSVRFPTAPQISYFCSQNCPDLVWDLTQYGDPLHCDNAAGAWDPPLVTILVFWRRNYFFNFRTPCI